MARVKDSSTNPKGSTTLNAFVRRKLLEHLAENWEPQRRLPPISDLAEHFNVSVGTVQQAVSSLVADGILVARRRVGTTLSPDCRQETLERQVAIDGHSDRSEAAPAPRLTSGRGKRVQIIRGHDDRMHVEISESCAMALLQRGAEVQLTFRERLDKGDPGEFFWADAIVIVQPPAQMPDFGHPRQVLLTLGTQLCHVDRPGRYDQIALDDEQGSFLAGRRMREAGCRNAAFLGRYDQPRGKRDEYDATSLRRLRGFERGFVAAVARPHRFMAKSHYPVHGQTAFKQFMQLDKRPDGIFAATDELAIGFVLAGNEAGVLPKRDYQIIGFDHLQSSDELPGGPLTTVEVPRQEIGVCGAELLIQRLAEPDAPVQRLFLGCRLFEGSTVSESISTAES